MKTRLALIFSAAVLSLTASSYGYPIPPRSLRQLFLDSELVVVAKVERIEMLERGTGGFGPAKAILGVRSVLKGASQAKTVTVYYNTGIICPAPPDYKAGQQVLAFLSRWKESDRYYTVALSYGAKSLSDEALKVYLVRIAELKAMLPPPDPEGIVSRAREWVLREIKDPAARRLYAARVDELKAYLAGPPPADLIPRTTEWLVKCAEDPATREEGLLDLDGPGPYFRGENEPASVYLRYLTGDQRARLVAVLKTARPGEYYSRFWASRIMSALAKAAGSDELRGIAKQLGEIKWNDSGRAEKEATLAREFLRKYEELPKK